jgi:hypothetical protein
MEVRSVYERLTRDADLVIGLERENIIRGLRALQEIGYRMSIPVSVEQFADSATRETWRRDKGMLVLKFWSDEHLRTLIDVFIYEPFDFATEISFARREEVMSGVAAPVVRLETLLRMKKEASNAVQR